MSMHRSYESMYLKKERNRLISQISTVDTSTSTVVHPFRGATLADAPSVPSAPGHRSTLIAQLDTPAGNKTRSHSAAISKSVSFNETVHEHSFSPPSPLHDETGALQEPPEKLNPPPAPRRPLFVTGKRVQPASAEPEPHRRYPSPARSRSPGSVRGVLADPNALAKIDWDRALDCRQAKQGNDPTRVKLLSEALRSIPLTVNGTKLNAVGVYITRIDNLPSAICTQIKTVFLSNNSLSDLKGVSQFESAKTVSFANNTIRYLHDVYPLRTLAHMDKLSLEGNIVVHMPYYRQFILALCPSLQFLDGVRVSPEERQGVDVLCRKGATLLEQLRTNELRATVLRHIANSVSCHAELIKTVCGHFSVSRGPHIGGVPVSDRNISVQQEQTKLAPSLANVLRCLESGGVFRWLQIGCDDSFGRTVQNTAYRIYLSALRNMPLDVRANLHHNVDGLRLLWDRLLCEYLHRQQDRCLQTLERCEKALHIRYAGEQQPFRLSGGCSREHDQNSGSLHNINFLELVNMSPDAPEYRLTYCGLGPHLLARPSLRNKPCEDHSDVVGPVNRSSASPTTRRVRSTNSTGRGRSGPSNPSLGSRREGEERHPEPYREGTGRKSPGVPRRSSSCSPTRVSQQTPLILEKLTEEERAVVKERENYVGELDGGYVELSRRYDDILQKHLGGTGSGSVRSSMSRSPPRADGTTTPVTDLNSSARQLYTQSPPRSERSPPRSKRSPPRSEISSVPHTSRDGLAEPSEQWSVYASRQRAPAPSGQLSAASGSLKGSNTPLDVTPFNSANASPYTGSAQFTPASLPPQQDDPDSTASLARVPVENSRRDVDDVLSLLLWSSDSAVNASSDQQEDKEIDAPSIDTVEPFNPEQEEVLQFLESGGNKKPMSRRFETALSMIQTCKAVWDLSELEKIMHNGLRDIPLGPHPEATRGSWMTPATQMSPAAEISTPGSNRKVSPKRGVVVSGDDSSVRGESMRSLKSQFESTSRTFGKIYEDIMTTYEAQQTLKQNAETLHDQLVVRSKNATGMLFNLKGLLEEEMKDLVPARRWVKLTEKNAVILKECVSSNEKLRQQMDACHKDIENLAVSLRESVMARDALNNSIDEVCTAAEDIQRNMTENAAVKSAIRYSHIVGLAVKHFSSKSYFGLIHLYFNQLRRRVRRQSRIRTFYKRIKVKRDASCLRLTLDVWMTYTTMQLRLLQSTNWVRRGIAARFLRIWKCKFSIERKVAAGIAMNWQLRKIHAMKYLYVNAADARRQAREEERNMRVCAKFMLKSFFQSWRRYLNRLVLQPAELDLLTKRAIDFRRRNVLLAWKETALIQKNTFYFETLIPCVHSIESNRLSTSLRAWHRLHRAATYLRRRRYATGFACMLRKILSCSIQQSAKKLTDNYIHTVKIQPAFIFFRQWAATKARYSHLFTLVHGKYRRLVYKKGMFIWAQALSESRRRRQAMLEAEAARVAGDLEKANRAMSHYLDTLLLSSFKEWRRSTKQSKSCRLIAQAEEELKVATEAYNKLRAKQKAAENNKAFVSEKSLEEPSNLNEKACSLSQKVHNKKKDAWLLSLDLVSSDDETTEHQGLSISSDAIRSIADMKTSSISYRGYVPEGRHTFSSTDTIMPSGVAHMVVLEYSHASHFEIRFKTVLKRLSRHAKLSIHYKYCSRQVSKRHYFGRMHRCFSHMLILWCRAAMRKVAVVKLYSDNKQSSALKNAELRATVQKERAELSALKRSLEDARAELADKQVLAQECAERVAAAQKLKNERDVEARKLQAEERAIEAETRSIVSQYEALVTKPSSQSNPLIKSAVMVDTDSSEASSDVYMTPEGSKYKQFDDSLASELGVHSSLSEPLVTQLMQMQAEKDSLNEEIHSLHLSYLSLQSTGDANEKLLKESKYTAEHLSEQCMSMVAVLEAQLKEMQEERQIASRVLLNCSRELSQNQALVAQKLGSIEADMMALESEEKDLSARLEAGQAEEKLLRDELERLWEEERELDTKENRMHASKLAADEMGAADQVSSVVGSLKPLEERLDRAHMRSGNDFLVAVKALGSTIESHVGDNLNGIGGGNHSVRAAVMKTTEQINRQRITELVELQKQPRSYTSSNAARLTNSSTGGHSDSRYSYSDKQHSSGRTMEHGVSNVHVSREGDGIDSEIAMIARRIRDRLMMPSSAVAPAKQES